MKFIVGEVVFVLNHPEIDIHSEAVEILSRDKLDKTYIVRKTTQITTLNKEYKINEIDLISPSVWLKRRYL
jgi:hypothetical protein